MPSMGIIKAILMIHEIVDALGDKYNDSGFAPRETQNSDQAWLSHEESLGT